MKRTGADCIPNMSLYRVPKGRGKELIWRTVLRSIAQKQPRCMAHAWHHAAAFFFVIILSSALLYLLQGRISIYSPKGEHLLVRLPDSSSVVLNADSRLRYNSHLWFLQRRAYLSGEALFRVERGGSFRVITEKIETRVLGTTFNVYAREGSVRVSCITGRVEVVDTQSGARCSLEALQVAMAGRGMRLSLTEGAFPDSEEWVYGTFSFSNAPIEEVLMELERQFDVDIQCNLSAPRFYSGLFFKSSVSEALDLVCIPLGLSWTQSGKRIDIYE